MNEKEFNAFVETSAEDEWNSKYAKEKGVWSIQSETVKEDYKEGIALDCSDVLNKACCDCRYFADASGIYKCTCKGSQMFKKEVVTDSYCNCFKCI